MLEGVLKQVDSFAALTAFGKLICPVEFLPFWKAVCLKIATGRTTDRNNQVVSDGPSGLSDQLAHTLESLVDLSCELDGDYMATTVMLPDLKTGRAPARQMDDVFALTLKHCPAHDRGRFTRVSPDVILWIGREGYVAAIEGRLSQEFKDTEVPEASATRLFCELERRVAKAKLSPLWLLEIEVRE